MRFLLLLLVTFPTFVFAAGNRVDYDIDDNGLIEINDLADLNQVRHHLDGTALYNDNAGCPESGCFGFELTTDLDFDTNDDGIIDARDTYWNDGLGWQGIGDSDGPFSSVFEGNHHTIRNLWVNRERESAQGLFGRVSGGELRNLHFRGELSDVRGQSYVGALAGFVFRSTVVGVTSNLPVHATEIDAGGIVGGLSSSHLSHSVAYGEVRALWSAGGVVGYAFDSDIVRVLSAGTVSNDYHDSGLSAVGGVAGFMDDSALTQVFSSAHLIEGSAQQFPRFIAGKIAGYDYSGSSAEASYNIEEFSGDTWLGERASLSALQCADADNTTCADLILYEGWGQNNDGDAVWDFGTQDQLPGLQIGGVIYRDSDGDGALDEEDVFPDNFAASVDADGDDAPDVWTLTCDEACRSGSGLSYDYLPSVSAASKDLDADGIPDEWNTTCNQACRDTSGLVLDAALNDTDNDGEQNAVDTDDDNDGIPDIDADGDGLIDIGSLRALDAIRYNMYGTSSVDAQGNSSSDGCPFAVVAGSMQSRCHGYELVADLDFDSNGDGVFDSQDEYWNGGSGWSPIGDYSVRFESILDGNDHSIYNLWINRPSADYQGLFGYVSGGSIRNLHLRGHLAFVYGNSHVGAIAGEVRDTEITQSSSSVSLRSDARRAGGLVGNLLSSSISHSFTNSTVISDTTLVGGIAGSAFQSHLHAVYASGTINASSTVGGLIGYASNLQISQSYSIVYIDTDDSVGSSVGNIVGAFDDDSSLRSSYYANDLGNNASNNSGAQGASLQALQCAGADDTACAEVTLFEGWADGVDDTTNWDFGDERQLPGFTINNITYRDSDADGSFDHIDAFPYDPAAFVDSDGDGAPDSWHSRCDDTCVETTDLSLDIYPEDYRISADADGDSLPDAWNPGCDSGCQAEAGYSLDPYPNDTDNDASDNSTDAFPLNAAAAVDSDNDGYPDSWNTGCDLDCQSNSGLTIDADDDNDGVPDEDDHFPTDPNEWSDSDGDGTGDNADSDDDNDGVRDEDDPNNGEDNGLPEIMRMPDDLVIAATAALSLVELAFGDVVVFDVADPEPRLEVSLDGDVLTIDENNSVSLPSGELSLDWVAIDDAGNRSEPQSQTVTIYPEISFADSASITGESSEIVLGISLSGPSPEYPIEIHFSWDSEASTADDHDLVSEGDSGIDLASLSLVIDDPLLINGAGLRIPVIEDQVIESDESLVIRIQEAYVGTGDARFELNVDDVAQVHTLTITDTNLPPEVSIQVIQGDETTTLIDPEGGTVTVSAIASDPNGDDVQFYEWNTEDLAMSVGAVTEFSFEPSELPEGEYSIGVKVTDNGGPPLDSLVSTITIEIQAPDLPSAPVEPEEQASNSSAGGGGAASGSGLLLLLLMALLRLSKVVTQRVNPLCTM